MTFIAFFGSICKINHVPLVEVDTNYSALLHSFKSVLPASGF